MSTFAERNACTIPRTGTLNDVEWPRRTQREAFHIQHSGDRSPLYELCGIRFELLGTFIPCIIFAVHYFRTFER